MRNYRYKPMLFERRTQESNLQAGITGRLLSRQLLHHPGTTAYSRQSRTRTYKPEGDGFTDRLLHPVCISADIV